MSRTVLIVDDEATQRRLVESIVAREDFKVVTAQDGQEAINLLSGPQGVGVGAMILDLSMPKVSGLDVIKAVRPLRPNLPIVVLTAHSSLSNAIECMRAGANDFLVKPTSPERIRAALDVAFNDAAPQGELRPLSEKLSKRLTFEQLVGTSPEFRSAVSLARKAAGSAIPVLIEGESGVGKELIAQSIQSASPRAAKPFVTVNCGAIPAPLVESILFGHEKGAFTGAVERHSGKFSEADGGTLFLDEVGELPLETQVKLLRVLQEGEIEPVGSRNTQKVDVRLISATNRDLAQEVAVGRFREDLFYRLNVVSVLIPPLRRRREDIPALVRHFIERVATTERIAVRDIAPEALRLLVEFDWPGNVRQLQNAVFRAAVLCDGPVLTIRDFPHLIGQSRAPRPAPPAAMLPSRTDPFGRPLPTQENVALTGDDGHIRKLDDLERDIIRKAIQHYQGRMSEVARRLGIGRSTLYRRLAELGMDADAKVG
jgi:DNA-binding NtrC family response regulator